MPNNNATITRIFMFSLIGPSGRGSSSGGGGFWEYARVPVSRSSVFRIVFFVLIFITFGCRLLWLIIAKYL